MDGRGVLEGAREYRCVCKQTLTRAAGQVCTVPPVRLLAVMSKAATPQGKARTKAGTVKK